MRERPKYRVLMLHNTYQTRGGEEESAESECRLLREAGHEVTYVTADNDAITSGTDKVKAALGAVWSPAWHRRVLQLLTDERFDILHVQNFFPLLSPSVYFAAQKAGVPVVQAVRNYRLACPAATLLRGDTPCSECVGRTVKMPGIRHRCYRGSAAATASVAAMSGVHKALGTWRKRVSVYVAVSQWVADVLVREGVPAERIVVKPCFSYTAAAPDPVQSPDRSDVLFVGRLSAEKGVPLLLDAWSRVSTEATLRIIGEGDLPASLPRNVAILGRKTRSEVEQQMAKAAFVVMPGTWAEPFGRVAIEAFSQGTPVLATNIGGVSDIVQPGTNGEVFKRGDVGDLARQIQGLLDAPAKLASYGRAARQSFEAQYAPARNLHHIEKAYETAMASLRPA